MPLVERLAVLALPRDRREEILGDLAETGRSGGWRTGQALGIAACYHGECYRDADDRFRIGVLFAAAAALVWVIPEATARTFGGPSLFTDPVTRAIVMMWQAAHVTSAVAAGLMVGRTTWLAPHTAPARLHLSLVLCAILFVVHPARSALVATAGLLLSAWVGYLARQADDSGPSPDDSIAVR